MQVVKSLSPDENNPLEIPEESASTAVFYQQYNEATIGKSEDTVSENKLQDSDFNDPSVCSTHAHCFFIDLGGMGHLNIVTHFLWK